jgi:hypothetical protein
MSVTDLVGVPAGINGGVQNAKQSTMIATLGNPREEYTDECQGITNPRLRALIVFEDVGPFKARGLGPAVASLRTVFQRIAIEESEVATGLGNMGMLCARLVRGSAHSISNHSWGTAIDLTLNGVLDRRGDNLVQKGLVAIAPIFNALGWFWGAGFGVEDGMHFEVSDALIRQWHNEGRLGDGSPDASPVLPPALLTIGDRGPEVVALQHRLNELGAVTKVDGIFWSGNACGVARVSDLEGPPSGWRGRPCHVEGAGAGVTGPLTLPACLTTLLWASAMAPSAANRSVYTPLEPTSCTTPADLAAEYDVRGLGVQECGGMGGWRLMVVASDANTWIELRSPRATWSGEDAIVYNEPIGQFTAVASGARAEWRIDVHGDPRALIVRLTAQNPRDSRSRVSRLLVVRLERDAACVIGRVVTNTDARRLADGTATCTI